MKFGSIEDMMRDVENRIDELEGNVESSVNISASIDDEDTEIDNIVNWLSDHPQAFEDFNMFFEDKGEYLTLDAVIDWISDHDTLYADFCRRFPEYCENVEACTASQAIMATANAEYVEKFCWEINDAVVGSMLDVDNVDCTFDNDKFIITVVLSNGEEADFEVPLSDLSCDLDTLDDDLDYVVSEIEAALLEY